MKAKYGYGIEQWFLKEGSVDYQTAINTIQNRIDEGWMWIVDTKSRGHQARLKPQYHPEVNL